MVRFSEFKAPITHSQPSQIQQAKNTETSQKPGTSSSIETDQKLHEIGIKILSNQTLTPTEHLFLKKISVTQIKNPNKSSKKIDNISKKIIKGKLDSQSTNNSLRSLLNNNYHDIQTQKSLAKLLLETEKTKDGTKIIDKIIQSHQSGRPLNNDQIKKLIDSHNKNYHPSKNHAGKLAFQTNDVKIVYDSNGKLRILPPDRLLTSEITLRKGNTNLTQADVQSIKDTYQNMRENLRYNNLSPMLEFASHLRNIKQNNPDASFNEALDSYSPDSTHLYQKYQSGDCVIAAGQLQSELSAKGLHADVAGETTRPIWSTPPIPDTSDMYKWDSYDQATDGIHHCHTVFLYSDESGTQKGLDLDVTFSSDDTASDIDDLKSSLSNFEVSKNIENINHTLKQQMLGKYKMVLEGKGGDEKNKSLLGVDLIKGNLYINTTGSKDLQLPTDKNGRVSINLDDLKHPDKKQTYSHQGKDVEMSAQKALEIIFNACQDRFVLPNDFTENITTLAENSDSIIHNALLPPISTAKQLSKEVNQAVGESRSVDAKLKQFKESKEQLKADYCKQGEKFKKAFQEFQQEIVNNNPDLAKQKFSELKEIKNSLDNLSGQIESQGETAVALL